MTVTTPALEPRQGGELLPKTRDADHLWDGGELRFQVDPGVFSVTLTPGVRDRFMSEAAGPPGVVHEHHIHTQLGRSAWFLGYGMTSDRFEALLASVPIISRTDLDADAGRWSSDYFVEPSRVAEWFGSNDADVEARVSISHSGESEVQVLGGIPGRWVGFCVAKAEVNSVIEYALTIPRPVVIDGLPVATVGGDLPGRRSHVIWKSDGRFWHLACGAHLENAIEWVSRIQLATKGGNS